MKDLGVRDCKTVTTVDHNHSITVRLEDVLIALGVPKDQVYGAKIVAHSYGSPATSPRNEDITFARDLIIKWTEREATEKQ